MLWHMIGAAIKDRFVVCNPALQRAGVPFFYRLITVSLPSWFLRKTSLTIAKTKTYIANFCNGKMTQGIDVANGCKSLIIC